MTIDRTQLDAAYLAEFARYKAGEITREELRAKIREIYAPLVRELIEAGPPKDVVWLGTEGDVLKNAVTLYESGYISQERAAEMAGLTRSEFIDELGKHGVSPFQTTVEELAEEVEREAAKMGLGTISEQMKIYQLVHAAIGKKLGHQYFKINMYSSVSLRDSHRAEDIKSIDIDEKHNTVDIIFKTWDTLEWHFDPFGQLQAYMPGIQSMSTEAAMRIRAIHAAFKSHEEGKLNYEELVRICAENHCPKEDVDGLLLMHKTTKRRVWR